MTADLAATRRAYALDTVHAAGSRDPRLVDAFAATPREDYLGPPPWELHGGHGPRRRVHDPRLLYTDALVSLAGDRGINNGQPTLHAACLAAVAPQVGETVLHVGAGTGYYTAILAELVGAHGRVIAFEIEPDLARQARANLRSHAQVEVVAGSGAQPPLPRADVIYVSAGATHPLPAWLDALARGGRLVFPLTPGAAWGVMLLVTHLDDARYAARALMRVAFIGCIGARDDPAADTLASALSRRSLADVHSLRRGTPPDDTAWCIGTGWWLSTAPP